MSFIDNNQCPINIIESTTEKQRNKRSPNVLPTLREIWKVEVDKGEEIYSQDFVNCDTSSQAIQTTSINMMYSTPSQLHLGGVGWSHDVSNE
jgi:hypothetical protein